MKNNKLYQLVFTAMIILLVTILLLTKLKGGEIVEELTYKIINNTIYLQ